MGSGNISMGIYFPGDLFAVLMPWLEAALRPFSPAIEEPVLEEGILAWPHNKPEAWHPFSVERAREIVSGKRTLAGKFIERHTLVLYFRSAAEENPTKVSLGFFYPTEIKGARAGEVWTRVEVADMLFRNGFYGDLFDDGRAKNRIDFITSLCLEFGALAGFGEGGDDFFEFDACGFASECHIPEEMRNEEYVVSQVMTDRIAFLFSYFNFWPYSIYEKYEEQFRIIQEKGLAFACRVYPGKGVVLRPTPLWGGYGEAEKGANRFKVHSSDVMRTLLKLFELYRPSDPSAVYRPSDPSAGYPNTHPRDI